MERGSLLAARVPELLLPSSASQGSGSELESSSLGSLDSELQGLQLRRPFFSYARPGSGPTPPHSQPPPPLPPEVGASVQSGEAGPVNAPHVAAVASPLQAGSGESMQLTAAPAEGLQVQQPPIERMGSRQPSQAGCPSSQPASQYVGAAGSSSTMTGSVAAAAFGQHLKVAGGEPMQAPASVVSHGYDDDFEAAPSSFAGSRSASPDTYAGDDFEPEDEAGDDASQGPASSQSMASGAAWPEGRTCGLPGPATSPGGGPSCSPSRPASRSASRSSSRLGYLRPTAAAEAKRSAGPPSAPSSRPGSASPTKRQQPPARLCSGRPRLEARVSAQMRRDPADWTVSEVCDWMELIGLGQYRRRFVHNAVCGELLLRLSNEELKTDLGIGPLGHREGLLTAINDLEQFWQQQREQQQSTAAADAANDWEGASSCGGCSRPGSPQPGLRDYSLQRAYAQRARLMRELEKAEGREAHRKVAAEQALRVVDQAAEEVRKLQASIYELDKQMGGSWQAAAEQGFDPLDVHGAVAWQPAGKQRAPLRRPGSSSPAGRPGSDSCSSGPGSPMSRVSRRIMESAQAGGSGGFLDRLSRDIEARQAKAAEAAQLAGRYRGTDAQMAEQEQERKDCHFLREMVEGKSGELAAMLASGDGARVAEACDDVAEMYAADFGLSDELVAAVKKLGSPGKKAAKLAGALRSAQFMSRLQQDLSTREARLQELQQRYYRLEQGNTAEQQEKADLAGAQAHFGLLGWPEADLEVAPGDADSPVSDDLLNALLKRAAVLQEARQRGKTVDWEQPEWKRDRLADMQADHNTKLQAALDEQTAELAAAAAERASGKRSYARAPTRHKELPQPANRLVETVELLAACRPGEVALLEGLAGYRKLIMTWRAVRAQQFIAFTRRDLQERKAKAAALEAQLYPDNTRVLPKAEFDRFFDRLMEDTQRRTQHRDELAEKAKAEALAKLMKSAPPPLNHQRQPGQRPASAQR